MAAKFFDDQYYNNAYYAKVGGVPCGELNSLETEFLFGVNFGLHVNADEFYKYRTQLANHSALIPAQIRAPEQQLRVKPRDIIRSPYDTAAAARAVRPYSKYVEDAHSCNAQHLSESKRAALFCPSSGDDLPHAQFLTSACHPLYG